MAGGEASCRWPSPMRALLVLVALWMCGVHADPFSARIKGFGTDALLPDDDLQRNFESTPAYDMNLDLRLMFHQSLGTWKLIVDNDTSYVVGDSFAFNNAPQSTLDQLPSDDSRRLLDLTWTLDEGSNHMLVHRFDRLAVSWSDARWHITVGRQAVSWGSGIVFQPMDLFNPFAPTTVDRDYKTGDDLVQVEQLFTNGSDLQLLGVFRRNQDGQVDSDVNSLGLKWHLFVRDYELEFMAGKHYQDRVYGFSLHMPVGGALSRTDWVATKLDQGDWKLSGIVNIDYSFAWLARSWYLFAEYYRNGFGVAKNPVDIQRLSKPLSDRLVRGEVFNLMRNYTAVGVQVQWHPLWSQSLTVLTNLNDHSNLLQTQFRYEPGDHQRLELGLIASLGGAGDEFGGIFVTPTQPSANRLTTGGGTRLYVRYAYYW